MIVTRTGTYRLTSPIRVGHLTSVGTLPAGADVEITQIDAAGRKVYGPLLMDWRSWDLPVRALPPSPASAAETEGER